MRFNHPDDIIALTPDWKGERFPNGRPKVPDHYLDAIRNMTLEELWKPIFLKGYENQFLAMKSLHPEFKENGGLNCKLIGRAVTAAYGPKRPDYYEASMAQARLEGRSGTPNQWVIDTLVDRDVIVIDMYDKIYKGTFVGGNLTTAIKTRTHTGGAVIWGGIRDIEQMQKIDTQVYYRGVDPTALRDFSMISFNGPVVMGQGEHAVMCLPGITQEFGFEMITANRWTSAQVDMYTWTVEMLDELRAFIQTDPRGADYRDLDWSHEYDMAIHGDPSNNQSAL